MIFGLKRTPQVDKDLYDSFETKISQPLFA